MGITAGLSTVWPSMCRHMKTVYHFTEPLPLIRSHTNVDISGRCWLTSFQQLSKVRARQCSVVSQWRMHTGSLPLFAGVRSRAKLYRVVK